jgi:predicted GNAT family acetyltransferase
VSAKTEVVDNAAAHRFEIHTDEGLAVLQYALADGRLQLMHTEVPEALEGHGYGGALARFALESARSRRLGVVPLCPFVRAYLERHPEYADLVRDG